MNQPMTTETRLTRLETKMDTVQRDVSEIKGDLRSLGEKIDKVNDSVSALAVKIASTEWRIVTWFLGIAATCTGLVITYFKS